eukprot:1161751-Pelagomonas_calceolata.AAC.1
MKGLGSQNKKDPSYGTVPKSAKCQSLVISPGGGDAWCLNLRHVEVAHCFSGKPLGLKLFQFADCNEPLALTKAAIGSICMANGQKNPFKSLAVRRQLCFNAGSGGT